MGVDLRDEVRAALQQPHFWHVASVNPDGSPHVTPVWAGLRGDRVFFSTVPGRKKDRNLSRDGRVALSAHILESYTVIAIQGRVVEKVEDEQALIDVNELSLKYTGKDYAFFAASKPDQRRVTYMIEPLHVWLHAWPGAAELASPAAAGSPS